MKYANLPKDLESICISYLSLHEQIYTSTSNKWHNFNKNEVFEIAAENDWLDLFIWSIEKGYELDIYVTGSVAFNGNLNILKWIINNCTENVWRGSYVCSSAAMNGHLHILKLLKEKGCSWDIDSCEFAAYNGHLNILKYMVEMNDCQFNSSMLSTIAKEGYLEIIEWVYDLKNYFQIDWSQQVDKDIYEGALTNGHLNILKWIKENNRYQINWDDACIQAAMNGNLDMLKYSRNNIVNVNKKWNPAICVHAANQGHLNIIEYAHNDGCELVDEIYYWAAMGNYLNILEYAHKNNCPFGDTNICRIAVYRGYFSVFKWAYELGFEYKLSRSNVRFLDPDHFEIFKYLHKCGEKIGEDIFQVAAELDKLDIIKWMIEELNFEWDDELCRYASYNTRTDILKWTNSKGYKFNKLTNH